MPLSIYGSAPLPPTRKKDHFSLSRLFTWPLNPTVRFILPLSLAVEFKQTGLHDDATHYACTLAIRMWATGIARRSGFLLWRA